jgi:hypothetical protein
MSRPLKFLAFASVIFAIIFFIATAHSQALSTPLGLTQAQAFADVGHNCGGIRVYPYATGFDANGNAQADVFVYTACSSGGRGGSTSYHTAWVHATWDLNGILLSQIAIAQPPCTRVVPEGFLFCVPAGLQPSYSANGYTLTQGHAYTGAFPLNYYPAVLSP